MALRVTHRSLFTSNLANLQTNLSRIQGTQERLSSGKAISRPSDAPSGTGAALLHRSQIGRDQQLLRNADDGLGWLSSADTALQDINGATGRVRELLISANNGSLAPTAREAIALEIEGLRDQLMAVANTEYLGRPIFGGTTSGGQAYDASGAFVGDQQPVSRSVRPGVAVQVNVTGPAVFGPPGDDLFGFLTDVADHLRNDPSQLGADLGKVETHLTSIRNALSVTGARYSQIESMRSKTDNDLLLAKEKLSEIEDIDLPATIVDLQLQETAYQAALSATARSVQPSLLDFLR